MQAAAIKLIFFSCLAYSPCTKASSQNENLTFPNEEMKKNALKQIGNINYFFYRIFNTTSKIDSTALTFVEDLGNKIDKKKLRID